MLVDVRGALGHVPAAEVEHGRRVLLGRGGWHGWVTGVAFDLVHLTAEPPGRAREDAACSGEVVQIEGPGAVVRLDGGRTAVLPFVELSWDPALAPRRLEIGDRVTGRVVGLTLDGPILSPRSVAPSPWPAAALAFPAGTRVPARVTEIGRGRVALRIERPPRLTAIVPAYELPLDVLPGAPVEATVATVHALAGALQLTDVSPASARAARPAPAAPTPARRGRGRA